MGILAKLIFLIFSERKKKIKWIGNKMYTLELSGIVVKSIVDIIGLALIYLQCASKKVRVSPVATEAPSNLAVISPFLSFCLTTLTIWNGFTYSSSLSCKYSEKKSRYSCYSLNDTGYKSPNFTLLCYWKCYMLKYVNIPFKKDITFLHVTAPD